MEDAASGRARSSGHRKHLSWVLYRHYSDDAIAGWAVEALLDLFWIRAPGLDAFRTTINHEHFVAVVGDWPPNAPTGMLVLAILDAVNDGKGSELSAAAIARIRRRREFFQKLRRAGHWPTERPGRCQLVAVPRSGSRNDLDHA